MRLYVLPLAFTLVGLALYAVLGGADFGAGFWQLVAARDKHGAEIRDHAHNAMARTEYKHRRRWLLARC